ncbi:Eukaryotic translation initiation factor eIF-1 [Knufia obscura]|nr:Eukaryotic translation initiation factor eIF-1 [Knufia obscura]
MSTIENLKSFDPFAEADDDQGIAQKKQGQDYIHIRIQQRNGRKTLTTVQGLPKKFDQKKILKVIKKKFACNGTIVADSEMGEVIQLQGDQRKDVQEFLVAKDGLELDVKTIKPPTISSLASNETAPSYETCVSNRVLLVPGSRRPNSIPQDEEPKTIKKSVRYPRVAVLLGVNQHYYIPLIICRSFSTIFALIWAAQACLQIYRLVRHGPDVVDYKKAAQGNTILTYRLQIVQVALSFVWALQASYLSHLFASSLMSRWLSTYTPFAVLIRLTALSIFLSYGCTQVFRHTGALVPKLENLSRCLPIWIMTCILLLVSYFTTQQDMSIERDRDDRRRRLVLRLKCLYTTAAASLLSLLILIVVIHIGSRSSREVWRDSLPFVGGSLRQGTQVTDQLMNKNEL